jgi:hypothetical protein
MEDVVSPLPFKEKDLFLIDGRGISNLDYGISGCSCAWSYIIRNKRNFAGVKGYCFALLYFCLLCCSSGTSIQEESKQEKGGRVMQKPKIKPAIEFNDEEVIILGISISYGTLFLILIILALIYIVSFSIK